MVLAKTCWYSTIHPCRLGALIGSRGKARLDVIVPFGFYLGAAFQVRDDLENLVPGEQYGKDAGGDIIEGKRTIPLLHLLSRSSPPERGEVERLISGEGPETGAQRIRCVLERMLEAGSLEYARNVADSFAQLALRELPKAFGDASSQADLEYICAVVLYLSGAVRPSLS